MDRVSSRWTMIAGLVASLAVTVVAMSATLADFEMGGSELQVTGAGTLELGRLLPGDRHTARIVELRASDPATYRLDVEWSGSTLLASQLQVNVIDSDGTIIYAGSLSGADASLDAWTGSLSGDGTESLTMEAWLPLGAGNEVRGAEVGFALMVRQAPHAADREAIGRSTAASRHSSPGP